MQWRLNVVFLFSLAVFLSGCVESSITRTGSSGGSVKQSQSADSLGKPVPGKAVLYVYKNSGLIASLRTWILTLDGKRIGEFDSDVYYRFELWPGTYRLGVLFPREKGVFGERLSSFQYFNDKTTVKAGKVYVIGYDGDGDREYTYWPEQSDRLSGRTLAKKVGTSRTAKVRKVHGGSWNGPSGVLNSAHGKGTVRWNDGRSYHGFVNNGRLTGKGYMQYRDGRFYKGAYKGSKPSGRGMLVDKNGQVIYAGNFSNGRPSGEGVSVRNGKPVYSRYNGGNKVMTDPKTLAKQEIARKDNQTLAKPNSQLKSIDDSIAYYEKRRREKETNFFKAENDYPKRCHCFYNLCLTRIPNGETRKEREAREAARERLKRACAEWRRSGKSKAERMATFNQEVKRYDQQLADLREERIQAERKAKQERQRKAAELERTRASREAQRLRDIANKQAASLRQKQLWCNERPDACGCAVFRAKKTVTKNASCGVY